MKRMLLLSFIILLVGCATTSGTNPKVSYSGFDKSKIVSINPHGNACPEMICTGIGAQWSEANPHNVILIVSVFNDYAALLSAKLRIDESTIALSNSNELTELSGYDAGIRTSSKGFVVPISVLESLLESKDVWLRVRTPTGYYEDAVIDGQKNSKAFHALRRFMNQVSATADS